MTSEQVVREGAPTASKEENREFQTGHVVTFSVAHAVHDTYGAFVAPLLPVLIENLSITRTLAGALTILFQFFAMPWET